MKKIIGIIILSCLLSFAGAAQDTLKGNYTNLHLTDKNYYVDEVVTISDSFIVDAGARLVLGNSVSIVCRGAVIMNGRADKRIYVESAAQQSAQGFVFAAYSPTDISISYSRFDRLVLPLNFEYGWYRLLADIHHNEFIKNNGSIAVVQVLNPVTALDEQKTPVTFTLANNLFAENNAPVYFEDLVGDLMKIRIVANAFTANTTRDYGKYTFSSNFLFGRMDGKQGESIAEITQNSFSDNTLWNSNGDSVMQQANMGVYGSMDSVTVSGNYWGQGEESAIRKGIYDYTFNYTSPKLVVTPFLREPANHLPPHVYRVMKIPATTAQQSAYRLPDGRWRMTVDSVSTYVNDNFNLRAGMQVLQLAFSNRPIANNMRMRFIYLADSLQMADTVITGRIDSLQDNTGLMVQFSYSSDSLFRQKPGYLLINGLVGRQDEYIPELKIGYAAFLHTLNERKLDYELKRKMKDSSGSIIKPAPPVIINTGFKRKYELGFMGAYALYYGTLSNKALFKNDFNSFIGLQFRYSIKKHISLSVSLMRMTLTGSDINSGDSMKVNRGMSFKTPVTNISFQVEYDFLDNSVYSSRNRVRPSVGFGIDYMKFAPKGEYLGQTFDLQSLGTGGQRLPGATKAPYALSSLGAPITLQLRYYLNKKTIYSVFASYHLAFTDYLDDVGPDVYPDQALMRAANPTNADAAAYFANPTNRIVGKSQLRSGIASGSDSFFTFGFTLAYHF